MKDIGISGFVVGIHYPIDVIKEIGGGVWDLRKGRVSKEVGGREEKKGKKPGRKGGVL